MPIRRNVTESLVSNNLMTGQTSVGISAQPGSRAKPFNREVGDKPVQNGTQSKPQVVQQPPHVTTTSSSAGVTSVPLVPAQRERPTTHEDSMMNHGGGGQAVADGQRSAAERRVHHTQGAAVTDSRVLSEERECHNGVHNVTMSPAGGGDTAVVGTRGQGTHPSFVVAEKKENLLNALREDMAPLAGYCGDVDMCKSASVGGKTPSGTHVEMATQENATKCHANEDRSLKGTCGPVNVFGVMDGHDGVYAVKLVQDTFLKLFEAELKAVKNVTGAVTETITRIENKLAERCSSSGACCLICVHLDRYVWCANLGDCRACFIPLAAKCQVTGMGKAFHINVPERNGVPLKNNCIGRNTTSLVWLSRDMKSCQSYERERIERAGGRVVDGRVEGLEPSRTVGDFDVKMRCPPSVISTEPEFRLLDLHDYGPGIILCCTDGIWDVLSGLDIDRIVKLRLPMLEADLCNPNEGLLAIAKDVVALAVARNSPDDCTAVCALVES